MHLTLNRLPASSWVLNLPLGIENFQEETDCHMQCVLHTGFSLCPPTDIPVQSWGNPHCPDIA